MLATDKIKLGSGRKWGVLTWKLGLFPIRFCNSNGFCCVTRKKKVSLDHSSCAFASGYFCGCLWLLKRSKPADSSFMILSFFHGSAQHFLLHLLIADVQRKGQNTAFESFPSHHFSFALHEWCAYVCDETDVTSWLALAPISSGEAMSDLSVMYATEE